MAATSFLQIGTAKYGVRDEKGQLSEKKLKNIASYKTVRMFELKMSQGAKPGKGVKLAGNKVTPEIAKIRGIPASQDSLSPNRHIEINSVTDLLTTINRIRDITGKPTWFKTVIGSFEWLDQMCRDIHRRGISHAPDFITIDSGDGGTDATD